MKKVTIRFKSGEEEDFLRNDEVWSAIESRVNPRIVIFQAADGSTRVYNLDSVESYIIEPFHEKEKPA